MRMQLICILFLKQTYDRTIFTLILHLENIYLELLTRNADLDKYSYSRYGIVFDTCGSFSLPRSGFDKDVMISGTDNSSYLCAS